MGGNATPAIENARRLADVLERAGELTPQFRRTTFGVSGVKMVNAGKIRGVLDLGMQWL
jgi:hypothetical protein